MSKQLLSVVEFLEHSKLATLYKQLGYEVSTEWQVRKAITRMRKLKPDVIVADFYFQSDFRDRLSNLESLLASAQTLSDIKILVLYEPQNQAVLDRVRSRLRMDATLTMPIREAELKGVLSTWI